MFYIKLKSWPSHKYKNIIHSFILDDFTGNLLLSKKLFPGSYLEILDVSFKIRFSCKATIETVSFIQTCTQLFWQYHSDFIGKHAKVINFKDFHESVK